MERGKSELAWHKNNTWWVLKLGDRPQLNDDGVWWDPLKACWFPIATQESPSLYHGTKWSEVNPAWQ